MTIHDAEKILEEMTETESLLLHAQTVAHVMQQYASRFNEDPEEWYVTGLLHDADYEKYPEQHPSIIVEKLNSLGEDKIAHAISAHYTKWNVPYNNTLDKALLACDELTGFIIACARVRPEGLNGLTPKSVKKKLKQKSFAAKVERDEIEAGINMLGVDMDEHIRFIIESLQNCDAVKEAL
ncbi:HD domain-containing protein [Fulvivirga sedimenti]|uniref:HD domain-containing protein n=1 Tax=Fulvivirga sedimenti TaxID=2879465 RepID=A0A9X1HN90_9BACT|nr:HD domain-containing protein [Fulvivirga sedimenti]MCA6073707.1 HD domain-containing protein [Fulvivirga sedimenti]